MLTFEFWKPWKIAVVYASFATVVTAVLSLYEGTIWQPVVHSLSAREVVQHPYIRNFSTVADFAVLNPLAIYFLLKAQVGYREAFSHFQRDADLTPFHKTGLAALAGIIGYSTMKFYFDGFIGQDFYSAAFVPAPDGGAVISSTGWAIFAFTALPIGLLTYSIFTFANYSFFILRLEHTDFEFRLPPAVSKDFKIAVAPCVQSSYMLTTLFVILVIFILRDYVQYEIEESRRIWLLVPYILACLVLFIPFAHLHRLMKQKRDEVVDKGNEHLERDLGIQSATRETGEDLDNGKLLKSVDQIQKLQSFYASIPTWPTSGNAVLLPNLSFLLSVLTILYKTTQVVLQIAQ